MINTIQIKLLVVIAILLSGIASYLAYDHHQRVTEEQKTNQAFERMRTEGQKLQPSGWAKSLKDK